MFIIKFLILLFIFGASLYIGFLVSQKYTNRVTELKNMKNALNIFETKIKFTYASVPEIFEEIGEKIEKNIGEIFQKASLKMQTTSAGEAWFQAIDETQSCMTKEDKDILKSLRKTSWKNRCRGTN